jgi:hypothetical protein
MRNGGILRRFCSVVVVLTVVSLALNEVGNTDEVTAEVYRNVIGNYHLDAEIKGSDRAVLAHQQLVSPLGGGELGAGLADGVEGAELTKHPILFGRVFQKFNGEIHGKSPFILIIIVFFELLCDGF